MSTDLLRARLGRGEWTIVIEAITPSPGDEAHSARVLALADAVRDDDRVAAVALTDRTLSPDGNPVGLAPDVTTRSAKAPLVHLAGKDRRRDDVERTLGRAEDAGIRSLLLTGGDAAPDAIRVDAVEMLGIAHATAPSLLRVAVLAPAANRPLADAWERAAAKREAGAEAFVAQVSWDTSARETLGTWPPSLGVPILGGAMLLTRGRLDFLAQHRIGGILVPEPLRLRAAAEDVDAALHRLALDLVGLRRLGYAGAHVSGLLNPARVRAMLDEADRLHAMLGDDWRGVWRRALGIA